MKKAILIALAILVLGIGLYRQSTKSNEVQPATASKVSIVDDSNPSVSHAKPPLPPGCATVECKGIKGHVDDVLQKNTRATPSK
ncbi:MAG: hypothetical protein PHG89_10540 [Gallionella sp.]|nr:hypothetical protein [Gallionella sp.]